MGFTLTQSVSPNHLHTKHWFLLWYWRTKFPGIWYMLTMQGFGAVIPGGYHHLHIAIRYILNQRNPPEQIREKGWCMQDSLQ
jgi:hypothetical protein